MIQKLLLGYIQLLVDEMVVVDLRKRSGLLAGDDPGKQRGNRIGSETAISTVCLSQARAASRSGIQVGN